MAASFQDLAASCSPFPWCGDDMMNNISGGFVELAEFKDMSRKNQKMVRCTVAMRLKRDG